MMARALSITKYIIRTLQKVFIGLYLSCLFPIDLIDVLNYFLLTDVSLPILENVEDTLEETNTQGSSHYLLVIVPATVILLTIVGGICDLHLDNLLLSEAIAELLMIAEEHVYKSEVTASNLYG